MKDKIQQIKNDHQSGSHDISKSSLNVLKEFLRDYQKKDINLLADDLNIVVKDLVKSHKNIVILQKKASSIVYYLKRLTKSDRNIDEIKNQTIAKIDELIDDANIKRDKIGELGARLIFNQNNILTISYSSILKKVLTAAKKINRKFEVYCLESRPNLEGQKFAIELAKSGIQTHIITDAMMGKILPDINMIFSGADRLYESGFVNKTGTFPLALISKEFNLPFYVACETDKILKEIDRTVRFYKNDPDEVCKTKLKRIAVLNYYFEKIPYKYVSKIICEEGVFETHEFIKWYLKD